MGGKLDKSEYLFLSFDEGLIANGLAESFPSGLFHLFLKGLPVMALEEGLMMIFPARILVLKSQAKIIFSFNKFDLKIEVG